MIFSKPVDALADPYEDIPVDRECTMMDYEVRVLAYTFLWPWLTVNLGRTLRNHWQRL